MEEKDLIKTSKDLYSIYRKLRVVISDKDLYKKFVKDNPIYYLLPIKNSAEDLLSAWCTVVVPSDVVIATEAVKSLMEVKFELIYSWVSHANAPFDLDVFDFNFLKTLLEKEFLMRLDAAMEVLHGFYASYAMGDSDEVFEFYNETYYKTMSEDTKKAVAAFEKLENYLTGKENI